MANRDQSSHREPSNNHQPRVTPVVRLLAHGKRAHHRSDSLFEKLSKADREMLEKIGAQVTYPRGSTLFIQGEQARGIFLVGGRVKLVSSSEVGRTVIVRIAESGEVLGLSKVLTGDRHGVTGETLEQCQAIFIGRSDLLRLLRRNGDAAFSIAQELAGHFDCDSALHPVRAPVSARARVSHLLLESAGKSDIEETPRLRLTHEEIAQLIGRSRETVTRVLGSLKRENLIELKQGIVRLIDPAELERLVRARE
jgi:CRP/FNR family transcriptional regulator